MTDPKVHYIIDMAEQTKLTTDVRVTALLLGMDEGFVGGTERFIRISGRLDQIEAMKAFLASSDYSPDQAGDTDDDI